MKVFTIIVAMFQCMVAGLYATNVLLNFGITPKMPNILCFLVISLLLFNVFMVLRRGE